jgi:hypothetical protein
VSDRPPSPPPPGAAGGRGAPSPADPPPPSAVRRVTVTLLAAVPWPLILFQLLYVVPRYTQMFRAHGLKPTGSTQLLLDLSMWANAHPFVSGQLTVVLAAGCAAVAYLAQSPRRSRNTRTLLLLAVFAVPCGLFVLTWVGVEGTRRTLVEGLHK